MVDGGLFDWVKTQAYHVSSDPLVTALYCGCAVSLSCNSSSLFHGNPTFTAALYLSQRLSQGIPLYLCEKNWDKRSLTARLDVESENCSRGKCVDSTHMASNLVRFGLPKKDWK